MLYKGTIGSVYSGKVGGVVASRNKGGSYFRHLKIPTNPRTPEQSAVRNVLSGLATAWKTLTTDQMAGWTVYASNTPIINRIGDATKIPPMSMYIKCNTPRIQNGFARIDDAPTVFGLGTLAPLSAGTFVAGPPSTVHVTFDNSEDWATAVGGGLFLYASRPQNPTINFFKGPYQMAGSVAGAVIPPTSPVTITLPFAAVAGQRIFFRGIASNADGRLSPNVYFQLDA